MAPKTRPGTSARGRRLVGAAPDAADQGEPAMANQQLGGRGSQQQPQQQNNQKGGQKGAQQGGGQQGQQNRNLNQQQDRNR